MKEDILNNLSIVINALNTISVSGKANLANLSGSIVMIEEVVSTLNNCDIVESKLKK